MKFGCADPRDVLRYLHRNCAAMQQRVAKWPAELHWVLSHDECTGGNVLVTGSNKKLAFLYGVVLDGAQLRESSWMTIACIAHAEVSHVRGGMSAVMAEVIRFFQHKSVNSAGFMLLGGQPRRLRFRGLLRDHEALASTFNAVGAAGLKPCFRCQNVLMQQSQAADRDAYFQTVDCADFSRCIPIQDRDLFATYDELLTQPCTTDAAPKERNMVLGFAVEPRSLRARPEREALPPSCVLFDPCHIYYANGIVASELVLFKGAMEAKTAVTLALIKGAVAKSSWRRCWQKRSHGETAYWKSHLFYDVFWVGSLFKGNASSCMALLPLWLQYAQELFSEEPALAAEMASLEALARCGRALARLRRAPEGVAALVAELEAAQAQHQAAFCIAYPGKSRPKHHFRFHLPSQLRQLGAYVDAFPVEACHRRYKSRLHQDFAQLFKIGTGKLSMQLLGRQLAEAVADARFVDRPGKLTGRQFASDVVAAELGLDGYAGAARCQVGAFEMARDDVVSDGSSCYLVRLCLEGPHGLQLIVEELRCLHQTPNSKTCARGQQRVLMGPILGKLFAAPWFWLEDRAVTVLQA